MSLPPSRISFPPKVDRTGPLGGGGGWGQTVLYSDAADRVYIFHVYKRKKDARNINSEQLGRGGSMTSRIASEGGGGFPRRAFGSGIEML